MRFSLKEFLKTNKFLVNGRKHQIINMNKSKVLKKVLAAFLIVLNFYSFTLKAQSTSCSVAATILPLNASCVNQAFSNNDDGLITASSSCSTSGTLYEDVFYRLIGNGAQITITISNPTQSGSFAVFSACGSGEIICGLFTGGATTKSIVFNSETK